MEEAAGSRQTVDYAKRSQSAGVAGRSRRSMVLNEPNFRRSGAWYAPYVAPCDRGWNTAGARIVRNEANSVGRDTPPFHYSIVPLIQGCSCRTKPISPAAEKPMGQAPPYVLSHHSTVPAFQHSSVPVFQPDPFVRNEPNFRVERE